jgi:hypothetical protein
MAMSIDDIQVQTQRLRHALSKSVREDLFKRFGEYNERLSRILGASDRISNLVEAQLFKSTALAQEKIMGKVWLPGQEVYKLLIKALPCQCRHSHQAHLLLQHRSAPGIHFQVIFLYKAELMTRQLPWTWQSTSIHLIDKRRDECEKVGSENSAMAGPTVNSNALPRRPLASVSDKSNKSNLRSTIGFLPSQFKPKLPRSSMKRKRTSIIKNPGPGESDGHHLPVRSKVAFAGQDPNGSTAKPTPHTEITNLCETVSICPSDLQQYGALSEELNIYLVRPLSKSDNEPQRQVTLKGLLSATSQRVLRRAERFRIALILASSYIQLYVTPWLATKLSKRDIIFFYDPENGALCIDHPYISKSLTDEAQHAKDRADSSEITCTGTGTMAFRSSIRNVGIMLLKLCFGRAIEDQLIGRH